MDEQKKDDSCCEPECAPRTCTPSRKNFKLFVGVLVLALVGVGAVYAFKVRHHHAAPAKAGVFTPPAEAFEIVQLQIDGMTCGGCAGKATKSLMKIKGVEAAEVDWKTGQAKIQVQKGMVDKTQLTQAVSECGFSCIFQ